MNGTIDFSEILPGREHSAITREVVASHIAALEGGAPDILNILSRMHPDAFYQQAQPVVAPVVPPSQEVVDYAGLQGRPAFIGSQSPTVETPDRITGISAEDGQVVEQQVSTPDWQATNIASPSELDMADSARLLIEQALEAQPTDRGRYDLSA